MTTAILAAAGRSERMGGNLDKAFLSLGPRPVIAYSLMALESCPDIDNIILVVRKDRIIAAQGVAKMFGCRKVISVVAGGSSRQASVRNGLKECGPDTTIVCVHDAARPCVTPELISDTVNLARQKGCGVAAHRITDTVKLVNRGQIVAQTIDRDKLWAAQTPQAFRFELLCDAFEQIDPSDSRITDEATAVELVGGKVYLFPTTQPNIKITVAEDLQIAARLLGI